MDFDTSVVLSSKEYAVLNVVSPLASFDFSAKVLSALPEGVKAADIGCGMIHIIGVEKVAIIFQTTKYREKSSAGKIRVLYSESQPRAPFSAEDTASA